jgi:hypothetical protein
LRLAREPLESSKRAGLHRQQAAVEIQQHVDEAPGRVDALVPLAEAHGPLVARADGRQRQVHGVLQLERHRVHAEEVPRALQGHARHALRLDLVEHLAGEAQPASGQLHQGHSIGAAFA